LNPNDFTPIARSLVKMAAVCQQPLWLKSAVNSKANSRNEPVTIAMRLRFDRHVTFLQLSSNERMSQAFFHWMTVARQLRSDRISVASQL